MENEAEILGGFQVEEKSVVGAVSEERIAERDVVGLDESKDLDDGDIFGEDMSTPKVLQERVVEPDSGPSGFGGGAGNVKIIGESGLQVGDGNANVGHGSEKFEEAFEVPSVGARGIINGVTSVGGKGVDEGGVVEGGTEMEIETVELNGSRDYGVLDGGESGEEKEVLEREDEVDLRSGQVVEKCANKDFDNVNFNWMPVDEKSENGGGDNVGGAITESLHETESSREILHEDGNGEKLKDDNLSAECQGNGSGVLKDATAGIIPGQEDDSSDEPRVISSYMRILKMRFKLMFFSES